MYPRRYLLALGLPGLIWVGVFVTIALYALLAIAVGGLDPLLLTPVPAWNPLHWTSANLPGGIAPVLSSRRIRPIDQPSV